MASDSTAVFADANLAFVDEDYTRALSLYTTLVEAEPSNPDFYLKRAAAHSKLGSHSAALTDAQAAIMLADGKADVVGKAHLRRGMALWELGKKSEARDAFVEAQRCAGGPGKEDAVLKRWLDKCEKEVPKGEFSDIPQGFQRNGTDRGSASYSNKPYLTCHVFIAPAPVAASVSKPAPKTTSSSSTSGTNTPPPPYTSDPTPIPAPAPYLAPAKIRHEYFQTDTFLTITVFVKNLPASAVTLNLQPRTLSLTAKLPTGSDYSLELDPLAHEIVPEESKHAVLGTKIEIKLKKKIEGIKWGALEGEETGPVGMVNSAGGSGAPSYPSSSKKVCHYLPHLSNKRRSY